MLMLLMLLIPHTRQTGATGTDGEVIDAMELFFWGSTGSTLFRRPMCTIRGLDELCSCIYAQ